MHTNNISELNPKKVFSFFSEISNIPRGSGNVKMISDYLKKFAEERNLEVIQDEALNIIIKKPASKGFEGCSPVILQGHMDMVAVKRDDIDKDMEKDGLDLKFDGKYLYAEGTSLGGDDGIAVAYMLAILDDDSLVHPPIEAVITVDEEVGMLGAFALDMSLLKGKMLINIDSEEEGIFTVSCAGGATAIAKVPYKHETVNAKILKIEISGLTGGHSGIEIDKQRANANVLMGRILLDAFQKNGMRIRSVEGGTKDNVIASSCIASIAIVPDSYDKVVQIINDTFDKIKAEYADTDPDATITITSADDEADNKMGLFDVMSGPSTLALVILMANIKNGVIKMTPGMKDMVQTSINCGVISTKQSKIQMGYLVRSSVKSERDFLIEQIRSLTEIFGGEVEVTGEYPGWEFNKDSLLRDIMVDEYKNLYGSDPVVSGVHAGLECGIFAGGIDGLDAISIGPNILEIHSVDEKLDVESAGRTFNLLVNTLAKLAYAN